MRLKFHSIRAFSVTGVAYQAYQTYNSFSRLNYSGSNFEKDNNLIVAESSTFNPNQAIFFTVLAAVAIAINYADRSNLSTAIIPMSQSLQWDATFSGIVLSIFWAGYAITQVIGGNLADKFGGELILPISLILWSVSTGLIPQAAHLAAHNFGDGINRLPLLTTRILLGAGEGMALPSVHAMIKSYIPTQWRSLTVSIITAACFLGAVLSNAISPSLIRRYGWEQCFTFFAIFPPLLWLPTWFFFLKKKKTISSSAAAATITNKCESQNDAISLSNNNDIASSTPLKTKEVIQKLLSEKSVWAIIVAQYTQSWGLVGLLSWLPSYFSDKFHIPVTDLAVYTTSPYILQCISAVASGYIADILINRGTWSKGNVRKLMQTIGMIGPALCLIAIAIISQTGVSLTIASTLLSIGLALSATSVAGVSCNHLELSTNYAGTIFAIGNTASCIAGLIAVPICGWIYQRTGSWELVFLVFALHYLLGSLYYIRNASDQPIQSLQVITMNKVNDGIDITTPAANTPNEAANVS
jgi:MFS transporter, ACS family, solute carrier family 17 (sodium-dependent inorganic phosphate cotransporter), other